MYPERHRMTRHRAPLIRLPDEGWIAGICAGIGEYLEVDASVVRIVTVLGLLTLPGTTILAYLIAWAIVPADRDS